MFKKRFKQILSVFEKCSKNDQWYLKNVPMILKVFQKYVITTNLDEKCIVWNTFYVFIYLFINQTNYNA